jgi:rubrerythrin
MERRDALLQGLELALKMEADGKKYYQEASEASSNEAGKKLFSILAKEEDDHARRFTEIYNHLKKEDTWPKSCQEVVSKQEIRTIFAEALEEMSTDDVKFKTEIKAVEAARKMEDESIALYMRLASQAKSETERSFFDAIIAEEREHSLALNDYAEYLQDPAGWFGVKERHSLDGA